MSDEVDPAVVDPDAALAPHVAAAEASKTANISTIRSIIIKLLADPEVFAGYDHIKKILSLENEPKLSATLDLFSYGTYNDYTQSPDLYLPLSEAQIHKLQQLSCLSVLEEASRSNQTVVLYSAFPLPPEDLLIGCLYAGAVQGKLSHAREAFLLEAVTRPRDVATADGLLDSLRAWQMKLQSTHDSLSKAISQEKQSSDFGRRLKRGRGSKQEPTTAE